jgi:hypothetical protein
MSAAPTECCGQAVGSAGDVEGEGRGRKAGVMAWLLRKQMLRSFGGAPVAGAVADAVAAVASPVIVRGQLAQPTAVRSRDDGLSSTREEKEEGEVHLY